MTISHREGALRPGLLAQVLVSKYCDHTPLYRQAQIFARHGARVERSTLASWVGSACWLSFLKTPSDAGSRPVRALETTAKGEIEGQ